jgi:GTP-binding protein
MAGVEVAFAGRSNVKSSLINALTGATRWRAPRIRRAAPRNFFDGPITQDCGWSTCPAMATPLAPKTQVASWTKLIHQFLQGRATLARVYVLIDAVTASDVDQTC